MQVRVLGCSGGIGAGLKTTCLQVGESILVDAGTGLELLDLEEMRRIRHLFITHAHLDHVACLPLMLPTLFEQPGASLTVHGSREVLAALKQHLFNWTVWPDYAQLPDPDRPLLRWQPLEPGGSVTIDGVRLQALAVNHPSPCQGYLVSGARESLAFSGDTASAPGFWRTLAGVEGLRHVLVDVSFPQQQGEVARLSGHYTADTLAADLAGWPGQAQLHITHLKPGVEEQVMAECHAALADRPVRRLAGGDCFTLE